MKKIILTAVFILLTSILFADVIKIPFSCFPKQLQKEFKKNHIKLDLSGNDRTKDSFGFINNLGTNFEIITYKSITIEELELIKKITFDTIKEE